MRSSDSSDLRTNKRVFRSSSSPAIHRKKLKFTVSNSASLLIKTYTIPLISSTTQRAVNFIRLQPYRAYTVGRKFKCCEFVFEDRRVSKRHCQILFDAFDKKVYIADGFLGSYGQCSRARVRVSLNGVFVNRVRVRSGDVVELRAGDEVSFVCGSEGVCSMGGRIGFFVEKVAIVEEVVDRNVSNYEQNGICTDYAIFGSECGGITSKADLLLSRCREILLEDDPILCIQKIRPSFVSKNLENSNYQLISRDALKYPAVSTVALQDGAVFCTEELLHANNMPKEKNLTTNLDGVGQVSSDTLQREVNLELESCDAIAKDSQRMDNREVRADYNLGNNSMHNSRASMIISSKDKLMVSEGDCVPGCSYSVNEELKYPEDTHVPSKKWMTDDKPDAVPTSCEVEMDAPMEDHFVEDKNEGISVPPPGNKFYLNRLHFMSHDSSEHDNVVSLPELLYPVSTLVRLFITTFTSDISWFLSYCAIPNNLPVTIACHNGGRCWSSSPDDRMSVPYSDYPNLLVVYPPFPEAIAFGQDRKKLGIACHHPKLIVLQREDSIRVIITSANLVPKQWHYVTNTVWWQDFPRLCAPDSSSLFAQATDGGVNQDAKPDFAPHLAKFVASLVADVPNQAHWILELTKYDFNGAVGYLVASIPGVHSPKIPYIAESRHYLNGTPCVPGSCGMKLLGSVEASVVGLSHLFRTSVDSSGSQLKKLAAYLGKCHENAYGMSEIVLRRNTNIPADANAISVLIPSPEDFNVENCIQLGFLPRNVAKWVAPLSDAGLFSFSAYIYRKDALASALEGSNQNVTLILYVSQGPRFMDMSGVTDPLLVSAICSLIASIQRSSGLWRLQEVLGHYKWPENSETDFIFGSSSIGAVSGPFLAAFSAAAGKRSLQFSESEESDPDWGCWSLSQESRSPSIRIIYPTIERVRTASCGIMASRYLLCFSHKTWVRLRNVGILHDAIPNPIERVGHPLHVKVGLRRFKSKTNASSCGWVYCGSHNFSAAAWGRPISKSRSNGVGRANAIMGSRLHISNYELGIIFIVPPPDTLNCVTRVTASLDEIVLPFVVPAPKYKPRDRPATAQAMREAFTELTEVEKQKYAESETMGESEEEIPDEEEEILEATDYVPVEKEDDKVYAEKLWSQVDSSQSC